jgi:two-component system phosphate regulon response regulator PhoB
MVPRVLIVDDDPETLNVLELHFSVEGWDVLRAEDGETALAAIESDEPDVVVLDWMMPGMSGLDVARCIREDGRHHLLPIVMLTARAAGRDMWAGLRHGADAYLAKPVDLDELTREAERVVEQIEAGRREAATLMGGDLS